MRANSTSSRVRSVSGDYEEEDSLPIPSAQPHSPASPRPSEPYFPLTPPTSQPTHASQSSTTSQLQDHPQQSQSLSVSKTRSIESNSHILSPPPSAPEPTPEEPHQSEPNQKKKHRRRKKRELSQKQEEVIIPSTPSRTIPETPLDDEDDAIQSQSPPPVQYRRRHVKQEQRGERGQRQPLSPPRSQADRQPVYTPPSAQPRYSSSTQASQDTQETHSQREREPGHHSPYSAHYSSSPGPARKSPRWDDSTSGDGSDHADKQEDESILAFNAVLEGIGRIYVFMRQDHAGRWRIMRSSDNEMF